MAAGVGCNLHNPPQRLRRLPLRWRELWILSFLHKTATRAVWVQGVEVTILSESCSRPNSVRMR